MAAALWSGYAALPRPFTTSSEGLVPRRRSDVSVRLPHPSAVIPALRDDTSSTFGEPKSPWTVSLP